jgi:hypothetical protein
MIALSLSGDTYPIRRELHSIGAIWSYELKAHIVPADRRELLPAIIGSHVVTISDTEVSENFFVPLTGEALREYRQARNARKAEKIRARSDRKLNQASELFDKEHKIAEFIPMGQPILMGHHSQRRHERDIERMHRLSDKACEALHDGERLKRYADRLEAPARIAGDAQEMHEKHAQMIRDTVKVGDLVQACVYGNLPVIKINRKTLQVEGKFGKITVDLSLVNLIPKEAITS